MQTLVSPATIFNSMRVLNHLTQPIDAANQLRNHLSAAFHAAAELGRHARLTNDVAAWQRQRELWLDIFRGTFPPELFTMSKESVKVRSIARHQREGYRIETLVFTSLWGWEVNAVLAIPDGEGPWPAIVIPCGHAGKEFPDHQRPLPIFAHNGFAAITFDPPMFGEHVEGNDHFHHGMAVQLTGLWSETFFAMDALRAIDYLATRADIDLSRGVGMTGVSGGGETTITCALLDDRIRCIAPVCCTAPQRVLGAEEYYTSCPELFGPSLFAHGIDTPERLAMLAPLPYLIVNASEDEVFPPKIVDPLVEELRHTYALVGHPERLAQFTQTDVGHGYTAEMTAEVLAWMRRWLIGTEALKKPVTDNLEPGEVLHCGIDSAVSMASIIAERTSQLASSRPPYTPAQLRSKVRDLLALTNISTPVVQHAGSELSWWHRVERVAIQTETDLWTPALLVVNTKKSGRNPAMLWIDDRGKWDALHHEDWLKGLTGFLAQQNDIYPHLCLLDARGWGETQPEPVAYDLASWNDIMRILTYMSNGLGRSMTAQRIHDALTTLAYLRSREDIDPSRILIGGHGGGALVALFAALLDGRVAGFVGTEMLAGYQLLSESSKYTWPHDIFVPNILTVGDVPDFMSLLSCPALLVNPLNALQQPYLDQPWPANVHILPAQDSRVQCAWCRELLEGHA